MVINLKKLGGLEASDGDVIKCQAASPDADGVSPVVTVT